MSSRRHPLTVRLAGALLAGSVLVAMAPLPGPRSPGEPPRLGAPAAVTAFVNVTVVPMDTERVLQGQTVVVENGRITALGPAGNVRVPAGAVRVDGQGKVMIPGLADMHAHMNPSSRFKVEGISPSDRLLLREHQLFRWLAHGLTTVRILDHGYDIVGGDLRGKEILQLRARAAAGTLLSPRISTSGVLRGMLSLPDTVLQRGGYLELSEVAEVLTNYKAAGFDFIKVHPHSWNSSRGTAVFDSVAAMARRLNIPLDGHTAAPLERALATHRSIEHLTGYLGQSGYAAVLDKGMSPDIRAARIRELALATQRAKVWNCPTLYNSVKNEGSDTASMALKQQLIKGLQDAGAGLLSGSDRLPGPRFGPELTEAKLSPEAWRLEAMYGYAGATHRELEALVERAGLTPYQALATSTRNVAAFFGTLDSSGTIAVGKRADLVLLAGNPLTDIRQTERIAGVMLGGRWLDRAALDARTAEISAWSKQWCASAAAAGQAACSSKAEGP